MVPERKRYFVKLTIERKERADKVIEALGLPSGSFSMMLDDALLEIITMLEMILEKKQSGEGLSMMDVIAKAAERLTEEKH